MQRILFFSSLVVIGCGGSIVRTGHARVICGYKEQNIERVLFDGILGQSRYLVFNKHKALPYEIHETTSNQLLGAYEKCVMMY